MDWTMTVAPSLAAIVWAGVWLQRERDRKVNQQRSDQLDFQVGQIELLAGKVQSLDTRMHEVQQHVSQLTDKAFR